MTSVKEDCLVNFIKEITKRNISYGIKNDIINFASETDDLTYLFNLDLKGVKFIEHGKYTYDEILEIKNQNILVVIVSKKELRFNNQQLKGYVITNGICVGTIF